MRAALCLVTLLYFSVACDVRPAQGAGTAAQAAPYFTVASAVDSLLGDPVTRVLKVPAQKLKDWRAKRKAANQRAAIACLTQQPATVKCPEVKK